MNTLVLAEELVRLARLPLPEDVAVMARRSLLNVLGTCIAGSRYAVIDATVRVAQRHGGTPVIAPPGRSEVLDPLWAALVAGMSAHLDDFDDTHLETVIHPGAATLGAALGHGADQGVDGARFVTAFALGCEVQLRVGLAMSPWHYDEGWHITGTCGVLGAAVAAGICSGLAPEQLAMAIGHAASETIGIRESFGTALKAFHPGKAAANGVLAVRLAEQGFSASTRVLEAPRGYFRVLSPEHRAERVMDGFGERWELLHNTFKPYPCGVVSHPAIDAAVALSTRIGPTDQIAAVDIACHPLVPELTGNPDPATGLEARFSTAHGVAVGLLDGRAGLAQYEDARVRAPDVTRLRAVCRLEVDDSMAADAAVVTVALADGQTLVAEVPHARGSLANPLSQAELVAKVELLVDPVLPGATPGLVEAVEGLSTAPSLQQLVAACAPGETSSVPA